MCFSAGVSFTSAAILIPAGLVSLNRAKHLKNTYWAFALIPIAFGMQQIFEGLVWKSFEANDAELLRQSALSFLFFSHFFWLVWIPVTCYFVENSEKRKTLFLLMIAVGTAFGVILFMPLLINPSWLTVSVVNHSIHYSTILIYDDHVSRDVGTIAYMFVMLPLMLSSDRYHRILGLLIFISMVVSQVFFNFAFVSVWCYFAAIISLYIYVVVIQSEIKEYQV
ncbi:MAG: hypothetical protein OEY66_04065 [Gammaproteobacteria bacterium]|nr:hypothetical protein [Gammaproteobacteria bacterium]